MFSCHLNVISAFCVPPPKILLSGRRVLIISLIWKEDLDVVADDVRDGTCSRKQSAAASWSLGHFLGCFLYRAEPGADLTWKSLVFLLVEKPGVSQGCPSSLCLPQLEVAVPYLAGYSQVLWLCKLLGHGCSDSVVLSDFWDTRKSCERDVISSFSF